MKPDPRIYEVALARIGASAGTALFVDDQAAYCDGAAAVGIDAVRIRRDRDSDESDESNDGRRIVTSLAGLETLF